MMQQQQQQQWNADSLQQLVGKFSSMEPAARSLFCDVEQLIRLLLIDCALQQRLGRAKLLDNASLENVLAKFCESTTAEPCSCYERAQRASGQTGLNMYSK
jgi:hypothetical protein